MGWLGAFFFFSSSFFSSFLCVCLCWAEKNKEHGGDHFRHGEKAKGAVGQGSDQGCSLPIETAFLSLLITISLACSIWVIFRVGL